MGAGPRLLGLMSTTSTRPALVVAGSLAALIVASSIGENLGIPDRSCPVCPIPFTGTVTAQLVRTDSGACWSSTFSAYKNRAGKITAKQ
jgi:hypothetical protein